MSNQRNDADSIVSQALESIRDSNLAPNIFNFNFNTYTNCYNSTRESGANNLEIEDTRRNQDITAEIEITEDNTISTDQGNTPTRRGVQTTTRSAIVPISINSSAEDISTRLQEVVSSIINDTETSDLQPVSAGISMIPVTANSSSDVGQSLTIQDINNNTEVFINTDLEQKCHICNELYKENDICRKNIKCGHYFHQSCIDTWYANNNKCPICDQVIT